MQTSHRSIVVAQTLARTADVDVPIHDNYAKYMHLVVDITAFTSGSLTVTVQGVDPASGKKYTILASAALAAVATTVLRIGPALTPVANQTVNDCLPKELNIKLDHADGTPITYSVGCSLIK